ncbi:concanavalin A-like lectin/glucanase domain-containing protein [Lipomyces arxii]|uniref:concanavalin A-like lectin/glucanase domain-containing protein n=1 Tax=Lipomyces arxii TaxID=56418 RepID=UPI0034CDF105
MASLAYPVPGKSSRSNTSITTTSAHVIGTASPAPAEYFLPEYLACTCYADRVANSVDAASQAAMAQNLQTSAVMANSTVPSRTSPAFFEAQHTPHPPFTQFINTDASAQLNHRSADGDDMEISWSAQSDAAVHEDVLPQIPSCWSPQGVSQSIDLSHDLLEAKFVGSSSKSVEQEAAAIRANHPIPPQCGLFYFEIKILSRGKDGFIAVGFCGPRVLLNKMPGWVMDSWGYHGDDGNTFACQQSGKSYGPQFSTNDVIGCGINFRNGTAFYTKNGISLETAFKDLKGTLYPAIGMRTNGEHIFANFGQEPFLFDIESYMREEKAKTYKQINAFPPPLESLAAKGATSADTAITQTIHRLISSYLAHNGYVGSVHAFSEDVQKETSAFGPSRTAGVAGESDIVEDVEAINRQKIRAAVLSGSIDMALKLTETFFPKVFEQRPDILFQLKCRKFVELMRQCASEADSEDVQMRDADMKDDSLSGSVEKPSVNELLSEALSYGQELHEDYRDVSFAAQSPTLPGIDVQKALSDIFALMAYPDPMNSPVSYLLDVDGRNPVAENLNSAILVSEGKSSVAPLERLIQHTTMLMRELAEQGGQSAFVNVRHDFLAP